MNTLEKGSNATFQNMLNLEFALEKMVGCSYDLSDTISIKQLLYEELGYKPVSYDKEPNLSKMCLMDLVTQPSVVPTYYEGIYGVDYLGKPVQLISSYDLNSTACPVALIVMKYKKLNKLLGALESVIDSMEESAWTLSVETLVQAEDTETVMQLLYGDQHMTGVSFSTLLKELISNISSKKVLVFDTKEILQLEGSISGYDDFLEVYNKKKAQLGFSSDTIDDLITKCNELVSDYRR